MSMIYVHEGQRRLGHRHATHQVSISRNIVTPSPQTTFFFSFETKETVELCRRMFPTISTHDTVSLFTKDLDICNGQLVEVYHESWETVVANLKEVVVVVTRRTSDIQGGAADNVAASGERLLST